MKSAEEIMNILEAHDLRGSFRDAGELAGCSHHTVARWVRAREERRLVPGAAEPRPRLADEYLEKLGELVDRSKGKIRADKGAQEDHRDGICRVRADNTAGGRAAEGGLACGPAPGAQMLGRGAGQVRATKAIRRRGR